ncbi:MAG TPA: hypothetical protein VMM77_07210 [Gemmatimonadaceae bacterium]|nr:hypothetical protein [Gemmatimonadaceae bacterium]
MPTKLEKTVKREIDIDGQPFTVAISPEGLKITQKGFRKGQEVSWKSLLENSQGDGSSASSASPGGSFGEAGGTGGAGGAGGIGGAGGGHDTGFR